MSNSLSHPPIDKFMTIKDMTLDCDFSLFPPINQNKPTDICIVYCVWSNPEYFKFLYISLISNLKFTDAYEYDIYIFVEQTMFETAKRLFVSAPVTVISVNQPFNKYSILAHESLSQYSKIVISDCDTFFCGKSLPLYGLLSLSEHPISMMLDPCDDSMSILRHRRVLSKIKDENTYVVKMADFLGYSVRELTDLVSSNRWFLSCFICIDKTMLNAKWNQHTAKFLSIKSWCDETVFLTYAWQNKIPVTNIEHVEDVKVLLSKDFELIAPDSGKLYLTHPLHGHNCHDQRLKNLYRQLLDDSTTSLNDT